MENHGRCLNSSLPMHTQSLHLRMIKFPPDKTQRMAEQQLRIRQMRRKPHRGG